MGTDGAGKEAACRKAAGEAKRPGSASQASRGRPEEVQKQKQGSRTVTLTTKNTPLSGENSAGGAYIDRISSRVGKNTNYPMGANQTMRTSSRTTPAEKAVIFPVQEPRKIYEIRRIFYENRTYQEAESH